MNIGAEFVRLPWVFDAHRMAQEIAQFAHVAWMAHPDGTKGNSAVALISRGGADNNDFRGEMKPTAHLLRCPYLQQVIASFDEVFGRSRLMRLDAGCEVEPHVDVHHHWHNHLRIHVPIVTNPDVLFQCGDARVHMQAGECWIFDSWQRHTVVNGGAAARVHLVIDTAGSARFWDTIGQALDAERAGLPLTPRQVPWEPGRRVEIATERYNLPPVLSPGEIDGLTQDLIADFAMLPDNDPASVALYCRLMRGFCKDWRALWYRHGMHPPGWPHYARLVADTSRSIPELDPPVLVHNLMTDARAAFNGRVLAVALSRDVYPDFAAARRPGGVLADVASAGSAPRRAPAPPDPAVTSAAPPASGAPGTAPARNDPCHCGSGKRYKHCHGAA